MLHIQPSRIVLAAIPLEAGLHLLLMMVIVVSVKLLFTRNNAARRSHTPSMLDVERTSTQNLEAHALWTLRLQEYVKVSPPACVLFMDWLESSSREHPVGVKIHIRLTTPLILPLITLPHHGLASEVMMNSPLSKEHKFLSLDMLSILLERSSVESVYKIFDALFDPGHQDAARVESLLIERDVMIIHYRFALPTVAWRHANIIAEDIPRMFKLAGRIHALKWELDSATLKRRMLRDVLEADVVPTHPHPLAVLLLTSFRLSEAHRAQLLERFPRRHEPPSLRSRRELLDTSHPTLQHEALEDATPEELARLYTQLHDTPHAMLVARHMSSQSRDVNTLLASGILRQEHVDAVTIDWIASLSPEDARQYITPLFDDTHHVFALLKDVLMLMLKARGQIWTQPWFIALMQDSMDELNTHNPEVVYEWMAHAELSEGGRRLLIDYFAPACLTPRTLHLPYSIRKAVFLAREPTQFSEAFIRRLISEAPLKEAVALARHGALFFEESAEILALESLSGSTTSQIQLSDADTRALAHDLFAHALDTCANHHDQLVRVDHVACIVLHDRYLGVADHDLEQLQDALNMYTERVVQAPDFRQSALATLTHLTQQSKGRYTPHYESARRRVIDHFSLQTQQGGLTTAEASDTGALSLSPEESAP